jgi:hypothetical protein
MLGFSIRYCKDVGSRGPKRSSASTIFPQGLFSTGWRRHLRRIVVNYGFLYQFVKVCHIRLFHITPVIIIAPIAAHGERQTYPVHGI